MVQSRMIDKESNTEYLLVDKADIDSLKSEAEALRRSLNGLRTIMKLIEIDGAAYKDRLNEYESNIVCRVVLSISKFLKNCFERVKTRKEAV